MKQHIKAHNKRVHGKRPRRVGREVVTLTAKGVPIPEIAKQLGRLPIAPSTATSRDSPRTTRTATAWRSDSCGRRRARQS